MRAEFQQNSGINLNFAIFQTSGLVGQRTEPFLKINTKRKRTFQKNNNFMIILERSVSEFSPLFFLEIITNYGESMHKYYYIIKYANIFSNINFSKICTSFLKTTNIPLHFVQFYFSIIDSQMKITYLSTLEYLCCTLYTSKMIYDVRGLF